MYMNSNDFATKDREEAGQAEFEPASSNSELKCTSVQRLKSIHRLLQTSCFKAQDRKIKHLTRTILSGGLLIIHNSPLLTGFHSNILATLDPSFLSSKPQMTRATRSQTVHQPQKSPEANGQVHTIKKLKESKKRKRGNIADEEHEDFRSKKLARRASSLSDQEEPRLDPVHAQSILEILEEYVAQLIHLTVLTRFALESTVRVCLIAYTLHPAQTHLTFPPPHLPSTFNCTLFGRYYKALAAYA
jgi:hypothetical protein